MIRLGTPLLAVGLAAACGRPAEAPRAAHAEAAKAPREEPRRPSALPQPPAAVPEPPSSSPPGSVPTPVGASIRAPSPAGFAVNPSYVHPTRTISVRHGGRPGHDAETTPNRKRCDAGDAAGCHASALDAMGRDDEEAAKLFARACESGHGPACNGLGVLYRSGEGVVPDFARAIELFELACDRGGETGCVHLAHHLEDGAVVVANGAAAARVLEKACESYAGARACRMAARMYGAGDGVALDPKRAAALEAKGCKAGDRKACRERKGPSSSGRAAPP